MNTQKLYCKEDLVKILGSLVNTLVPSLTFWGNDSQFVDYIT